MDPAVFGVNVTVIVHCAFTGKLWGQLLVWAEGAVVEITMLAREATPVLVNVEVWGALVVFTGTFPNCMTGVPTVPIPPCTGQVRVLSTSGGSGVCRNAKLSVMLLAEASRCVMGERLKRYSMNFKMDENS